MHRLARELAELAWQLEEDADSLRRWSMAHRSVDSTEAVRALLATLDRKLDDVHADTRELIQRVPRDLTTVLHELRETLLARLSQAIGSVGSVGSGAPDGSPGTTRAAESPASAAAALQALTPQERRVFQLCFQSGFLSYQEIAAHLDITPSAAKNLVNRLWLFEGKRALFAKQYQHGAARIGVQPELNRQILGAGVVSGDKLRGALALDKG